MSGQVYASTAQRTFRAAVIHLLETEYGLLGSRRVLELLAQDLEALAEQFYPTAERIPSGWMVFTGTRASGKKARPGRGRLTMSWSRWPGRCCCPRTWSNWPLCLQGQRGFGPVRPGSSGD